MFWKCTLEKACAGTAALVSLCISGKHHAPHDLISTADFLQGQLETGTVSGKQPCGCLRVCDCLLDCLYAILFGQRQSQVLQTCAFTAHFARCGSTMLNLRTTQRSACSSSSCCAAAATRHLPCARRHLATSTSPSTRRSAVMAQAALAADTLRVYDVEKLGPAELKSVLARPRIDFSSILSTVRAA